MELNKNNFKCHFCPSCDGYGCIGELPGMGGFSDNINFQKNCEGWDEIAKILVDEKKISQQDYELLQTEVDFSELYAKYNLVSPIKRLGPMTGGVENVGYFDERQFYFDLIDFSLKENLELSLGDGCPDEKLKFGIEAVKSQKIEEGKTFKKAAVFIKPYPISKIFERIEWASEVSEYIGVDIDSYNIVTMRNLVQLEKKTASQLAEIRKKSNLPFVVKGIFTIEDIELVKELKPDVAFVSNHGGRVENRIGSTAEFLYQYSNELKNYCGEVWVDGGIRTKQDEFIASFLGAKQVLLGRPVISALCEGKNLYS